MDIENIKVNFKKDIKWTIINTWSEDWQGFMTSRMELLKSVQLGGTSYFDIGYGCRNFWCKGQENENLSKKKFRVAFESISRLLIAGGQTVLCFQLIEALDFIRGEPEPSQPQSELPSFYSKFSQVFRHAQRPRQWPPFILNFHAGSDCWAEHFRYPKRTFDVIFMSVSGSFLQHL